MNKKQAFLKTLKSMKELLPMLFAILLIISLLKTSWLISWVVQHLNNSILWVIIADLVGSISAWSAVNSYIIVKGLWDFSQYMLLWTVFMISWVTIWVVQMPFEAKYFWKKFTIIRNVLAFLLAIVAWYLICFLFSL